MTIADILRRMTGVWHGTYTVLDSDGKLIERFMSQQEGRMEGTNWTEKVTYFKGSADPVTRHYRAIVEGDDTCFVDQEMWGRTVRAGEVGLLFTFGWNARPRERVVELSMPRGDYRTRLWQHFEDERLVRLTLINEQREPGREPERWYTPLDKE